MKNILFWVSAFLVFVFWPVSFVLANLSSGAPFLFALLVILTDWLLILRKYKYHFFLYLLLPLIHPGFLLIPVLALFVTVIPKKASLIAYLVLLIIVSMFSFKTFFAGSILAPDLLATDTLVKKISLIPSRNLARIFYNKTTVFQQKFRSNLFMSLDTNNYFFSRHPQEIGQNLNKFPYPAIIPFLIGLYFIFQNPNKKWIVSIFSIIIFSIAFLNDQDRFDLLLHLPISLLCFYGLRKLKDDYGSIFLIFTAVFIPISLVELFRLFIYR